jgi:hypothetical protein
MGAVEQSSLVLLNLKDAADTILELAEDGDPEELFLQACEAVPEGYPLSRNLMEISASCHRPVWVPPNETQIFWNL